MNGQSAHFILLDECLLLRPETNLQPPTVNTIDTVRTIVAKHLPENEPLPKRNWLQRWLTNPEPDEQPTDLRIVGDSSPIYTEDFPEQESFMERAIKESFTDRLVDAQMDAIAEARRTAAREAVLVAALHLETHYSNLDNQTSSDTIVRAATYDCIQIVRGMLAKMHEAESGGA